MTESNKDTFQNNCNKIGKERTQVLERQRKLKLSWLEFGMTIKIIQNKCCWSNSNARLKKNQD